MEPTSCYIPIDNQQLHYVRTGSGSRLLLGFPGYGHDAQSLLDVVPYLENEYTCLLFDMPHHGKSTWQAGTVFTKPMLASVTQQLLKEYNCKKASLLGYSMGGRVCLTIVELMPQNVDKITLVASDGLAFNTYYAIFTRTWLGKWLFSNMLNDPAPYHKLINRLKARKWITDWQYKFVQYYTGDEATRKKLSQIWPAMSRLIPTLSVVKKNIRKYKLPVNLFMGTFDKVIPAALGHKFAANLPEATVTVLNKGHRIIGPDTAQEIAQTLI